MTGYKSWVRTYYDSMTPVILKDVGHTYQAGTLIRHGGDAYHDTNIFLAGRARIAPGMRVLDAGCGACGPAVDVAMTVDGVTIDAITISEVQADAARAHVRAHELADRIRVHVGDFHEMPFSDRSFDVVYFFESSVYTEAPTQLFGEAFRVLKPGGSLYIKDVFHPEPLTEAQRDALAAFDRMFRSVTKPIAVVVAALTDAGFVDIDAADRSDVFDTGEIPKAMVKFEDGQPVVSAGALVLTDFGRAHAPPVQSPVFFGEIRASRPRALPDTHVLSST